MPFDPTWSPDDTIGSREHKKFGPDSENKTSVRVISKDIVDKLEEIVTALNGNSNPYTESLAGETVGALKFVYIGSNNKVFLGNSSIYESSAVIGMTINGGDENDIIKIQHFGPAFDPAFSFGFSNPIYLTSLGNVSTTSPIVGHRVKIGQGLSNGGIFIDIDEIIVL